MEQDGIGMRNMNSNSREEDDNYETSAPLIQQAATPALDRLRQQVEEEQAAANAPKTERTSGGWFVWALTFSAGISGLLFGYEYVYCSFSARPFFEVEVR